MVGRLLGLSSIQHSKVIQKEKNSATTSSTKIAGSHEYLNYKEDGETWLKQKQARERRKAFLTLVKFKKFT